MTLTFLALLGVIAAVVALGWVWRLQQDVDQLTRRLDRYNRALFDAGDQVRLLQEELQKSVAALHVELQQRTGTVRFTPETTVREAEIMHPQAGRILAGFHLGGCADCAIEPESTLAQVCHDKGVEMSVLLANLNLLVQAPNGGAAEPVKLPNVSLEL